MTLNIASLNVRGLRDSSKCTRLLGELKKFGVDVTAVQETHFTCSADCRVLESDFNVFSAYGSRTSTVVSLLVGRSLWCWCWRCFCRWRGPAGCGRCLSEKFQVLSGCGLCIQYLCGDGFLFSSVGAVSGRYEAASLNGWLECDPWSQDR